MNLKGLFRNSFNKAKFDYIILILLTILLVSIVIQINYYKEEFAEKKNTLFGVAKLLDKEFKGSFNDLLQQHNALNKPKHEQVEIINHILQPRINELMYIFPNTGLGYYSQELDSIVAFGPNFNSARLTSPPSFLEKYKSGKLVFVNLPSFIWEGEYVLGLGYPLYREDKLIGYVFTSIKFINLYYEIFMVALGHGLIIVLVVVLFRLRSSEDRATKVFHASPSILFLIGTDDSRFIDINESFERITGYQRKEVIGRLATELSILHEQEPLIKLLQSQDNYKKPHEVIIRTKSGEHKYGIFLSKEISIGSKKVTLCVISDITERKQMEKEIARLDRLNLIGQMAAGIGHEVRNPMTTVRGFLQLLTSKTECVHHKEYFKIMIEELDRANSIITEFLAVAKNKVEKVEIANLNTIISTLYPLILADAMNVSKSVTLSLTDIPDLHLDEKEIRQLILNLARNGLEAMTPGGTLTIETYRDGDEVIMSVKDLGKGINSDALPKIGVPFFTTKAEGTGLGLATCYSIANRHNAKLVFNTSSNGTTFFVRFPLTKNYRSIA